MKKIMVTLLALFVALSLSVAPAAAKGGNKPDKPKHSKVEKDNNGAGNNDKNKADPDNGGKNDDAAGDDGNNGSGNDPDCSDDNNGKGPKKCNPKPDKPNTDTPDKPKHQKVTLCHATGSATNPFVVITVSKNALKRGHALHVNDIIPVPANGCPVVDKPETPDTPDEPNTPDVPDVDQPNTDKPVVDKPVVDKPNTDTPDKVVKRVVTDKQPTPDVVTHTAHEVLPNTGAGENIALGITALLLITGGYALTRRFRA